MRLFSDTRAADLLTRADKVLGRAVSDQMRRHHRRRLDRHGWRRALEPQGGGWAAGDPPPRSQCSLDVLIDGAEALPAIAGALAEARSHVHLSGWTFSASLDLTRGDEPVILRNLLAELAERIDVRMIAWAGSPLPLFRPARRDARAMRERLCGGTRIACVLDDRERPLHCHHEKTIVIDDRIAFVGGIDLTTEGGDRFDSSVHAARVAVGWHDVTTRLEGPAVGDVAEHFRLRWHALTGDQLPAVAPAGPAGTADVQVVRTIPEHVYSTLPRGDFRILESYLRAFEAATELIYLENQFLWSPEIARVLARKLDDPPNPGFRVLVVLPARPTSGGDDTRGVLSELVDADDGRRGFLACALYARHGRLVDPVYVHAKVGIVDDAWLTIGSANLNDHSLFNDTEVNVVTHDRELARDTRLRLWSEHLEMPAAAIDGPPADIVDATWRPVAEHQLRRLQLGLPLTHRLVELPGVSRRSARLLGPLQGLIVDG